MPLRRPSPGAPTLALCAFSGQRPAGGAKRLPPPGGGKAEGAAGAAEAEGARPCARGRPGDGGRSGVRVARETGGWGCGQGPFRA